MLDHKQWRQMTDDEFREQILVPVLAEASKRQFTIKLDPFALLGREGRREGEAPILPDETTERCDECGAEANPTFGNAPGPWHEEACSLYGTRIWEPQGVAVGDTVLVRLHTPGPGGPPDPRNSASWENYKRHFTRLVEGEVVGRESLFHVKFEITEDNYDDWEALMPDHVGMPGDRHWDEHETYTIGSSWVDYDVEPEWIERVIRRADLTRTSQSG